MTVFESVGPDHDPGGLRLAACFLAALGLHIAVAFCLLPRDSPPQAPDAPEAVIMIDLPAELTLPAAESVQSIESESVAESPPPETTVAQPVEMAQAVTDADVAEPAGRPTDAPSDAQPPETRAVTPPDAVADARPLAAETAWPQLTLEAEPPPETVDATGPLAIQAEQPVETVVAAALPPKPTLPVEKPAQAKKPVQKPLTKAEAAKPAKKKPVARPDRKASEGEKTAQDAAAPKAGQKGVEASGAGRPDKNALARYLSQVRADIMRARRSVKVRGGGRTAAISFTISSSGALGGIAVARSTGDPELDQAALAIVRRAGPVPAIPPEVGKSSIASGIPVLFD